ncbi:MAG: YhgE/Pip family protein, partial [Lachnospiraceae bacterium]|nr:YhgE/Pip family protein [Lachnospiraceae bacterium]
MNTIQKIFIQDVKHICSNIFLLIIALGVCVLPALYAWCNIYSNWDPYGNTGNLKVAAVSLDEGFTDEDGSYSNSGDAIIENLHENDKIDWQFVKTEEAALEGVKDGSYYAALVIPKDFTYNMYHILFEDVENPTLLFYQNQKKNPVANKITDTVVETLQGNIEEQFIMTMTRRIFQGTNTLSADLEAEGGVDGFIEKLESIHADLESYQKTIDVAIRGNATLLAATGEAMDDTKVMKQKAQSSADTIGQASDSVSTSKTTISNYSSQVNTSIDQMQTTLNRSIATLNEATLTNDVAAMVTAAEAVQADLSQINTNLAALLAASSNDSNVVSTLTALQSTSAAVDGAMSAVVSAQNDTVQQDLETIRKNAVSHISDAVTSLESMQSQITNSLTPQINQSFDGLQLVLQNSQNLMSNMAAVLGGMGDVYGSLQLTANSATTSLEKTSEALGLISQRLTDVIDKVKAASESDKAKILMETLSGDPEVYGEFFAEPVVIDNHVLYPVDNYG